MDRVRIAFEAFKVFSACLTILFLWGCTTVQPEADFTKLGKQLGISGDYQMLWEQSEKNEEKIKGLVIQALEGGLTRNEAVSVALLNNRMLQSAFEEIGIAKSDLIQAGLYSNPNLGAIFRFPTEGDESGTNIELGASFSASDLWQIPLKRKLEEARFNRITLEVGDQILKTRHDTQAAYNRTYFLLKTKKSAEDILHSFKTLTKASKRRQHFGYMTDLDIYLAGNAEAEAVIEFAGIEMEHAKSVARLARTLGLSDRINDILITENLPVLPHEYPGVEEAVESALERRMDLKLNKVALIEAERKLALQKARKIRQVQLGANWEKESSGNEAIGPEMEIELPLFDQNQAQIARAEYEIRLVRKRIQAKEGQIREQIIAGLEEIKYLKKKLEIFEKQIIPLRQKALDYSQKWGMRMQINRVTMLDVRKDLLASQLELLQIRLELNQAVNDLEYHMGGSI